VDEVSVLVGYDVASMDIQIKMATCKRMDKNRMPKVMLNYRPNGRRRLGRPFKKLLDEAEAGLPRLPRDG
jgi:hypothetical protein